jgi:hypothetical protein
VTAEEYKKLYIQARKSLPNLSIQTMKKIRSVYRSAAKQIAEKVKAAQLANNSELTITSLQQIEAQLETAANQIMAAIRKNTISSVETATVRTSNINVYYLSEAFINVDKVTAAGIKNMYLAVNTSVIESMVNRVYQDGYTFSDRIWKIGRKYQTEMKDIITTGFSMGRSTIQVAKDIQAYTAGGKFSLVNRYGPNLIRIKDIDDFRKGKAQRIDWKAVEAKYGKTRTLQCRNLMKRIGNRVDSNALRLTSSELHSSLQDAALKQGKSNVACSGWYDWILEAGRQHWKCVCPDLASDSPYEYENVPGYPHSRCRCQIRPRLRDSKEFQADLKRWSNGERVDYIDEWYNGTYLAV